jgi:hypothetical protein
MNITQIAMVCHETNRAYCKTIEDYSQEPWIGAEEWQRQSAIKGVQFALANLEAPPSAQHQAWLADKVKDGWKYGPVKDAEKKEHPCVVPYGELPLEQKIKDYLFKAIVRAFAEAEGVTRGVSV